MAEAKFLTGSTLRHIAVMTSTSAVGMMALFVVDLVDLYFLSLLGETELAAAVGFAGAILFFASAICIGLAVAMGALVARAVGAGEHQRAKRYVLHVSLVSIILTAPLGAGMWIYTPELLDLIGAQGRTHELATVFMRIVLPSTPILALAMSVGGVLRAVGAARLAMSATLAGGLINAVFDPILIFTFDMGIAGAAWASVLARLAVLLVGAYAVIFKMNMLGSFKAAAFLRDLKRISAIAGPAMLANIATPVGNSYVTASMSGFGVDAVAAYSVIGRIIPVAFGVVFVLSGAVGPVIGQNFGAGKYDRSQRALRDALLIATGWVVAAAALLFALQDIIASGFGLSAGATDVWRFFATYTAVLFVFLGAQFIAHAAFNNLGKPLWSAWSNWGRATLGTIPLVWLGAMWLGPYGILLGQAAGGVVFGTGAFLIALRLSKSTAGGGPDQIRHEMFRVPLSPTTEYRGWMGLFGRDRHR